MGTRIFNIYILLIYVCLNTHVIGDTIMLSNTDYRNLNCLVSPNFCDNIVKKEGCLRELVVTKEDLDALRGEYLSTKLFDTIYEWFTDSTSEELKEKLRNDFKEGYIWVFKHNDVDYELKDYLYIALEMKESSVENWVVGELSKYKINNIIYPTGDNILYGGIKNGFSLFRELECDGHLDDLEEDEVNIIIPFEYVGGIFEVRSEVLYYPIIYIPIIKIETR